jgi:molybdopterin/thiamine biosynthesis adenylyltransferase
MISKMNYLLLSTMMIAAIDSTFGRGCDCCKKLCEDKDSNESFPNSENNKIIMNEQVIKRNEEENKIDPSRVKKLMIRNRKVGSFGPMCAIIANFVGMEAIKVLTGCTFPANANRRGEFDIYTMDIKYNVYKRVSDCKWCGENGKYHY